MPTKPFYLLFELCICVSLSMITSFSFAATPTGCLSAEEEELIGLVNAYRNQNGLPSIPVSLSLSLVAQWHVIDLHENNPDSGSDHGLPCNGHSWSNAQPALWGSVCYTGDHQYAHGMWDKPSEITNNAYSDYGYEIAIDFISGQATASGALDGWKNSPAHNAVIVELDIWSGKNWPAMGVGIYEHHAVVWFGDQTDPQGTAEACGSDNNDNSGNFSIPAILHLLREKP